MTSQREAKKASKATQAGVEDDAKVYPLVKVTPWEHKLRAAIMTRRPGIIEAQLTAWEGWDPRMHQQAGEERTFRFDPAAVTRAARLRLMLTPGSEWPLYGGRGC